MSISEMSEGTRQLETGHSYSFGPRTLRCLTFAKRIAPFGKRFAPRVHSGQDRYFITSPETKQKTIVLVTFSRQNGYLKFVFFFFLNKN